MASGVLAPDGQTMYSANITFDFMAWDIAHAGNPEWLVRLLLRLGSAVTVEEPAEVSESVHRAAVAALANYQSLRAYDESRSSSE